mmetsp:Transcript_13919/g.29784  ORF Transcript_13919/g.29784 Transcript_13919/m.29784 type:complete len:456 (-) Transcript_13919:253-1620(-)
MVQKDGNPHDMPESEDAMISRISVLRRLECGPYRLTDYLSRDVHRHDNDDDDDHDDDCCVDGDDCCDCSSFGEQQRRGRGQSKNKNQSKKKVSTTSTAKSTTGTSGASSSSNGSPRTIARSSSTSSEDAPASSSASCDSSTASTASTTSSSSTSSSSTSTLNDGSLPIDAECRAVMVSWYHSVLDHCTFSTENGGIAAYLLDMYLCGDALGIEAQVDRKKFQLVSMTALFLAIKMNECETITPGMVAKLSRGSFDALDVAKMETIMLRALHWHVNPPTPLTFVHHYMELLRWGDSISGCSNTSNSRESRSTLRAVLKYSKIQVELCTSDYFFVTVPPSVVAYAAILNAATCLGKRRVSPSTLIAFYQKLVDYDLIEIESSNYLSRVRDRLLRCVEGPSEDECGSGSGSDEEQHVGDASPGGSTATAAAVQANGKGAGASLMGRGSPRCISKISKK